MPTNLLPFCMILCGISSQVLSSQTVEVVLEQPDFDRWFYPFNATPGERAIASTFTAFGSEYDFFDDRDGQLLLGFQTGSTIASGLGAGSYEVVSARVTLMIESDDIVYDATPDSWQTFLPEGPADEDPGRATIISGVGFRKGNDGWSIGETGPFGTVDVGGRNAYPIDFDDEGTPFDISNNITEGYDPTPFGIGLTSDVSEGEVMPTLTRLTFELDTQDSDIQCYLRHALDGGLLNMLVTSLHPASEQGEGDEPYADWIMKESSLVFFGFAEAAGLELQVKVTTSSGVAGDINGDMTVDIMDLLEVLNEWGCSCCISDLNGDGSTNIIDLLAIIANWG